MKKHFEIDEKFAGQRLDKFLADWLEQSRGQTLKLLEQGKVSLGSNKIDKSFKGYILREGDVINVSEFRLSKDLIIFPNSKLELQIVEDDAEYVVINKKAGMNIIPKTESEKDTVLNALVANYPQIQGIGEAGLHSGVVHRLDKDTSGVLIVAKTQEKWQSLREAFSNHKSKKVYHAIVEGHPLKSGNAKMNLLVSRHKPVKVRAIDVANKKSRICNLSWTVLDEYERHSLLEIRLGTGFLHQIRVMMAELGHTVLADKNYGSESLLASRQMLHAYSIDIDGISAVAEYPSDFSRVLKLLS